MQHASTTLVWLTGYKGEKPPHPRHAKSRNWVPSIQYFLVFTQLFFAFFGSFWTVVFRQFRVLVYINPHLDTLSFLNIFLMLARGPLPWPVSLFQLRFPPWLKPLGTQLVYCNLIFLNNFLLGYTKNAENNMDSANVNCTTVSSPRPMLATTLFTTHFAMVGFRKSWVVWRLISLTYQVNMNIEMGNVWNQFLVSSVLVALYAVTKVLSQTLSPPFCLSPFGRGVQGGFSPGLIDSVFFPQCMTGRVVLNLLTTRDTTIVLHQFITLTHFLSSFHDYFWICENRQMVKLKIQTIFFWWLDLACKEFCFNKPYNRISHIKLNRLLRAKDLLDVIHCCIYTISSFVLETEWPVVLRSLPLRCMFKSLARCLWECRRYTKQ